VGGNARAVLESAGVSDVLAKSKGSSILIRGESYNRCIGTLRDAIAGSQAAWSENV